MLVSGWLIKQLVWDIIISSWKVQEFKLLLHISKIHHYTSENRIELIYDQKYAATKQKPTKKKDKISCEQRKEVGM